LCRYFLIQSGAVMSHEIPVVTGVTIMTNFTMPVWKDDNENTHLGSSRACFVKPR